jgi:hypothetical protein
VSRTSRLVGTLAALAALTATGAVHAAEPVPPAVAPATAPPPAATSEGFMLGAGLSYVSPLPAGGFLGPPALGAGPAVGARAGYRWGGLYLGAAYQHAFLGGGTWEHESTIVQTSSASSDYGGVEVVGITAIDAPVAVFFGAGIGYRVIQARTQGPTVSASGTTSASNLDVTLLGLGVEINAGGWLRIVPEASFEVGPADAYLSFGVTTYLDLAKRTQ